MENRRLTLVEKRKSRKLHKLIVLLFALAMLSLGIYLVVVEFSIEDVKIKGNTTYSEAEIVKAMQEERYVNNTLVMVIINRLTGDRYLPFIDSISMSVNMGKPHVLKVKVKEKIRAGVFQYMDRNVYFDSEGYALESRNLLFDGVPVVTGVKFDKMVLGEKIPVSGNYFNKIISITKKISTYNLNISRIHFESEEDIYLVSGNYQIYLGSSINLTGKMSRIPAVLESISQEFDSGIIDMHLCTEEKQIITFREE